MKHQALRSSWLAILLAAALAAGCGSSSRDDDGNGIGGNGGNGGNGNGNGNGNGDNGELVLLPLYDYQFFSAASDPLTAVLIGLGNGDETTLRVVHAEPGQGLSGTLATDTDVYTIAAGSEITIEEVADEPALFGSMGITATALWTIPPEGWPSEGQLTVAIGDDLVIVTVNAEGTGVNVALDEDGNGTIDAEVDLSWAEFDSLGDEAPFWQQVADFGYGAMVDFMFELLETGLSGIGLIEPELADLSPLVLNCDAFSDIGWVPPTDLPDAGLLTFTWLDDSADGAVGSGDSFLMEFDHCLDFPDGEANVQEVLHQTVALNNYVEEVQEGTLVRLAFAGESAAGRPGGLVFDDFERLEVGPDGGDPAESTAILDRVVINGRLVVEFTAPEE